MSVSRILFSPFLSHSQFLSIFRIYFISCLYISPCLESQWFRCTIHKVDNKVPNGSLFSLIAKILGIFGNMAIIGKRRRIGKTIWDAHMKEEVGAPKAKKCHNINFKLANLWHTNRGLTIKINIVIHKILFSFSISPKTFQNNIENSWVL